MNLVLFVHDCFFEIGHSNSCIELINNIDPNEIKSLRIVAFSSDDPKKIFPKLSNKCELMKVPFANLSPVLIKILWYHLWTILFTIIRTKKSDKLLGTGIASLTANVMNIQFIHLQWSNIFLKTSNISFFKKIYKRIFFLYVNACEKYLYTKPKKKFLILSNFITSFFISNYGSHNKTIKTVYSGVNIDKFSPSDLSRSDLFAKLLKSYPELTNLDISKPIALFVGAYERKGLNFVINSLAKLEHSQLIIIGKPESIKSNLYIPSNINHSIISHTTMLPLFYSFADAFIFPTIYEPFGLVITEACASGMELFITRNCVGAAEILENLPGVNIFDNPEDLILSELKITNIETRKKYLIHRNEVFIKHSWQHASNVLLQLLKQT